MRTGAGKIVSAALAVFTGILACGASEDGLSLYCNYDGSADATYACGDKTAKCAIAPEFQPGVRGQAVVVGGQITGKQKIVDDIPVVKENGRNCYYSSDKNVDVEKGSVSFWLKPLDWDGKTPGFNVFFRTGVGSNFFMLYKFWSTDQLLFLRGGQAKWTSAENKISDWKSGQWHHVVATWSPAEMRLFIDGDMVCARRVRYPFECHARMEPLSVGPGGSWDKAFIGRSLVDEFRIHDRPLSKEEVVRLYRQDSANVEMDAGLITVGEKTPALDGLMTDFEYAFASTGFPSGKGSYALSYDRTNLYVAVRSELDSALPVQAAARDGDFSSSERVELFLRPGDKGETGYRFVFTPSGCVYDEKNGHKQWDGGNVLVKNAVSSNVWTLEAAIPFSSLGLKGAPDGRNWRINIGRLYSSPDRTDSLAPVKGSLDDRSQFITLSFRPDAPFIRIASWRDQAKKQSATDVSVISNNNRSEIRLDNVSDTTKEYGVRSHSATLFAQGKATPYKSPVWTIQQDFSLSESRIVEKLDGKDMTLYHKKSIYEDKSPLKTLFLYTQAKKRLFVSALRRADGKIQARFLRPDGTCAFQARQDMPADSTYFNALFDLDFSKLTPGDYTVKIDYIAPDGKSAETWEQAYRIPKKDDPMFHPYVDEESDKVPAPWTALRSDSDKVEMWGRSYDFSKGVLFSSLVSQGKEILSGPAELRLDGSSLVPVQPATLRKRASTDMLAEWDKGADLGRLKVESRIKTHFDGYCEIAMTLVPTGGKQAVKTLSLDIPLRNDAATLVRDSKHSSVVGSKSGAVGEYWCQDFSGGSFVWVGNDTIGFNWLAPNLENWNCKITAKNVEILRRSDTAILRLNLVDTPLTLNTPRTIRFGFTLTPSRPLDRKVLRMRDFKELQMWCQPWKYFAYPDYDTANRGEIERAGEGVKDVFLYFGDGLTSPFSPEWAWWEEDWRGTGVYGEWANDFNEPKARDANCYVGGCGATYFNFMQNKRHAFFERAKTPLSPKARNYYFDTGASTQDSYREQALNVYRMIRRTGPDAKIWTHQGLLRVMPMQHFTDIICGGEGLGDLVGRDGNYYGALTPEMFRATYSPYIWGMKMVFLDMTVRMLHEKHPDKLAKFSLRNPIFREPLLHSYGYCVVHDVDIDDSYSQSRELREAIWAAQDKLGWGENVKFFPYWENDAVKLASPKSKRIMASAYSNNGKLLLAALNDTDQEQAVKLALDLDKLGVKAGLSGHDVWQPEKTYKLSNEWEDKIPARGFRLVLFDNK